MRKYDKNYDGLIDYREFLEELIPDGTNVLKSTPLATPRYVSYAVEELDQEIRELKVRESSVSWEGRKVPLLISNGNANPGAKGSSAKLPTDVLSTSQ